MRKKNVTNEIIRECITEALIRLMESKPFHTITVTEITKLAGVGRISFYRNYESKEDVLVKKLDEAAIIWWEEYRQNQNADYILGLFQHALEMKDFLLLLYRHNLSHLLMKNLNDCLGPMPGNSDEEAYNNALIAGSAFGVGNEWIRRGMTDSPEKMSALLSQKSKYLL